MACLSMISAVQLDVKTATVFFRMSQVAAVRYPSVAGSGMMATATQLTK